ILRCGKEWKGNRCHISAEPLQPPTSSLLRTDIWIGLGIGFLLIKITAAVLYFLSKKKVPGTKLEETAVSFANPLYENLSSPGKVKSPGYATSPTVQISVSPWHEYPFSEHVNATSFPNPLYDEASEDMEKLFSSLK
ncbi:MAM and LDL-receptor class A domain-containing protein C10orf112, partial [Tauraco erythrolophus]